MAYLRIFIGDKLLEQRELKPDRTTIGRSSDNDIVLKNSGVSKRHAVIERQGENFVLIDNDSSNGTFVAGKRVKAQVLNYWDEIQIFNFVLKFMAVARAKGEEAGSPEWEAKQRPEQEKTMELDISSIGDLAQLKKRAKVPYLAVMGKSEETQFRLDMVNFTIGRSPTCDLNTKGFFAPSLAARIQRRNDGFYVIPARRGKVALNHEKIIEEQKLNDGDTLLVRGIPLRFYYRAADAA